MHPTIQLDDLYPRSAMNPAQMQVDWIRMYNL
jgi:hypothetical protein